MITGSEYLRHQHARPVLETHEGLLRYCMASSCCNGDELGEEVCLGAGLGTWRYVHGYKCRCWLRHYGSASGVITLGRAER
jgi:hypothetical protein